MDTSDLTTQVNDIIGQLHELFDEIGVPSHERESRETELFAVLSEALQGYLQRVNDEKNGLVEEAQNIIKAIRQMERSLDDSTRKSLCSPDDPDLRITYPLTGCLAVLKEKYNVIYQIHQERFEQVKKLVEALESYSSHLEPSFVTIELPPTAPGTSVPPSFDLSPAFVDSLDKEFTRVYEEYNRRLTIVQTTAEEIVKLWAELGTPQAQTEPAVVQHYRDSPEQLGLHESDIASLKTKRDRLVEEKKARERKLKDLKSAVETLWNKLGVEESDQKEFLAANRGCSLRVINEFEEELDRLNELKRQNLPLFVEDARCRLQELWDRLFYSEEEMLDFTPAFSDVYSDALLSAHEQEIARLEMLKEQRAPALQLIEKHRALINDRETLAASSQDASRLLGRSNKGEKRDPARLLREEKMRKRIAKELPKVEEQLRKVLEKWEEDYGRPFLVYGERYLDELAPPPPKNPPRSKTPSGPASVQRANSTKATPAARPASALRGGAKTPTPGGTLKRSNTTSAVDKSKTGSLRSPNKIPVRAPLSNLQNSPERRTQQHQHQQSYSTNSLGRSKMPPPRAPPPKMRPLVPGGRENANRYPPRCESAMSGSISSANVRSVSPDDVYDDRVPRPHTSFSHHHTRSNPNFSFQTSFNPSQSMIDYSYHKQQHQSYLSQESRPQSRQQFHHQSYISQPPRPVSQLGTYRPPSSTTNSSGTRQTSGSSNTSTINTVTSGSENWETYDDTSEPEADATEVYYAKLRATQDKRMAMANQTGQYMSKSKCIRPVEPGSSDEMD
ncbi:hypothetical protein VTO42DRAFT_7305 [Malbranchea cinnamomea]